jgi:uncharacterized protein (DUF58 family)
VGAVIFDDAGFTALRPQRSRGHLVRILEAIVAKNAALRADSAARPSPGVLNEALQLARSLVGHDYLVVIASDFDGADRETRRLVLDLSEHNDVVAMVVHDPSSKELPEHGRVVVTGGELQVQVDVGQAGQRQTLLAFAGERIKPVLNWTRELGVPVLPLSTAADVASQIARLLGASTTRRLA